MFCSDLDGTLTGDPEATRRFSDVWNRIPEKTRPLLTYATGRLVHDAVSFVAVQQLPSPDYLIGGVGVQIYDPHEKLFLDPNIRHSSRNWNLEFITRQVQAIPGICRQSAEFQHCLKSSWYLPNASSEVLLRIRSKLTDIGQDVCIVYSSQRDLDILPAGYSKGDGVAALCRALGVSLNSVIVAGDTGNDASMFLLSDVRRILVANALPELVETVEWVPVFCASRVMADGVLEGLQYFRVIATEAVTTHQAAATEAISKRTLNAAVKP